MDKLDRFHWHGPNQANTDDSSKTQLGHRKRLA